MATDDKNPGMTLRRYREAAGLTQAELAAKAGLARDTIAVYESGAWPKQIKGLLSMAAVLGCTIGELVGEDAADELARLREENAELKDGIEAFIASMPRSYRRAADRAAPKRRGLDE